MLHDAKRLESLQFHLQDIPNWIYCYLVFVKNIRRIVSKGIPEPESSTYANPRLEPDR